AREAAQGSIWIERARGESDCGPRPRPATAVDRIGFITPDERHCRPVADERPAQFRSAAEGDRSGDVNQSTHLTGGSYRSALRDGAGWSRTVVVAWMDENISESVSLLPTLRERVTCLVSG